jgi:hypothetical protein
VEKGGKSRNVGDFEVGEAGGVTEQQGSHAVKAGLVTKLSKALFERPLFGGRNKD